MNNWYRYISAIGLVVLIAAGNLHGQIEKKKTTKLRLEYFKDHNNTESIVATFRIKEKRYVPLSDVDVSFYSINDTSNVLLDKVSSNENGDAVFIIDVNSSKIFKDSLGFMSFKVEYKGNATNKDVAKNIIVKQMNMDVSFFQKDTIKYIDINVQDVSINDQSTPIKNIEVGLYIKGTFSLLNIAQLETDENGNGVVEFPIDMPGDTLGVLTIVAQVEEHDIYGTVISTGNINWGKPVPLAIEKQRGLGDTDAPLWMVYTLIILLSAVWFHYLYVIFLMVKIKLAG
jgi:hypothetical protein